MTDAVDELGPVDYLVVEFPPGQQNFSGEMASELARLHDSGIIRVLDNRSAAAVSPILAPILAAIDAVGHDHGGTDNRSRPGHRGPDDAAAGDPGGTKWHVRLLCSSLIRRPRSRRRWPGWGCAPTR